MPDNVTSPKSRESLSGTRRNTLLAAKYENTVTDILYSKEEIDRILSWVRAENMVYSPDSGNPNDAFVDSPKKKSSENANLPAPLVPSRSISFYQQQGSLDDYSKSDMQERIEKMELLLLEMKKKIDDYTKLDPTKIERTISL